MQSLILIDGPITSVTFAAMGGQVFQLSGHKTGCCVMVQAANLQGDQFSSDVGWPSPIGLTDNCPWVDLYRSWPWKAVLTVPGNS